MSVPGPRIQQDEWSFGTALQAGRLTIETTTLSQGPLSPEQFQQLVDARIRSSRVRRAATIAAISGWTLAVFAGLTLLGVLWGDVKSLVIGIGLSVVAWNELRGSSLLRHLDPRGASVLGFNQLGLAVLIVGYAGWSLLSSMGDNGLNAVGGTTGDAKMDDMVIRLTRTVTIAVYGSIAAVGVVVPALTAWYYFTRGRLVRSMLAKTPTWVTQALRAAA